MIIDEALSLVFKKDEAKSSTSNNIQDGLKINPNYDTDHHFVLLNWCTHLFVAAIKSEDKIAKNFV